MESYEILNDQGDIVNCYSFLGEALVDLLDYSKRNGKSYSLVKKTVSKEVICTAVEG